MKKKLTSEAIEQWNQLKFKLSINELIQIGISASNTYWDEENVIARDCILDLNKNIPEMNPKQKALFISLCMEQGFFEIAMSVWEKLTAYQGTSAQLIWDIFQEIKQYKINTYGGRMQIDMKKVVERILIFSLAKTSTGNEKNLFLVIAYDLKFQFDKYNIQTIYLKYLNQIKTDNEKLFELFKKSNKEYLKETGFYDMMLTRFLIHEKEISSTLKAALDYEATYQFAVQTLIEKIAPKVIEYFSPTEFIELLDKLKDEDRRKVLKRISPIFIEAGNLLNEFSRSEPVNA